MEDKPEPAGKAKAERLRAQIRDLARRKGAPEEKPRAGESPREFVERRMRELEQERKNQQ